MGPRRRHADFLARDALRVYRRAADAYLAFEFEELAAVSFDGDDKRSMTIEIYRHSVFGTRSGSTRRNARSKGTSWRLGRRATTIPDSQFLSRTVLRQVDGVPSGEEDAAVLTAVAKDIAEKIGGAPAFPERLRVFSPRGPRRAKRAVFRRDVLGTVFSTRRTPWTTRGTGSL